MLSGEHALPVTGIGPFGDIAQRCLIGPVGRAIFQDETTVAIPAIDIAVLVYLKIDAWVAQSSRNIACATANCACAVTADAARIDHEDFGRGDIHGAADNRAAVLIQSLIVEADLECAFIDARSLIWIDVQRPANPEYERSVGIADAEPLPIGV